MNYAFLPDLSALTILIVILLMLHRRHPHKQVDLWVLGLLLTLIEGVAHSFYSRAGMPDKHLHVIVVDCYLLSGLVFTMAARDGSIEGGRRLAYIAWNGLPLLAINTLYGLHYRTPGPYLKVVVMGMVVGTVSSIVLRNSWVRAALHIAGWMAMGILLRGGSYREMVYWSLACVYGITAFNFRRRLPDGSTGKLAIVTGFSIWALCFLTHPWVAHYEEFVEIASHIWNMQKSLISIGMILVMLEEQVASSRWLALHDELTGLPNRRSLEERLSRALGRAGREKGSLAVLMLDLNGFKTINDSLGHQAGDQVLREVSKNLCEGISSFDTLARLGGDEFTLVARVEGRRDFDRLLDEARRSVERPLVVEGQSIFITASIGVAVFPEDAVDAAQLLRVADQRMYLLKQRPRQPARMAAELAPVSSHVQVVGNGVVGSVASQSARIRVQAVLADEAVIGGI